MSARATEDKQHSMICRRVYCPELTTGELTLSPEESHHAVTVLRSKVGDELELFDGKGNVADASINKVTRRHVTVTADRIEERPADSSIRLTLAVAMPKAQRQAFLVEKCTELGVSAIWPLICERSVAIPKPSAVEKWTRRVIEAAKQSKRCWLPTISLPIAFSAVVEKRADFDAVGLLNPAEQSVTLREFVQKSARAQSMLLLVGPEGGWTNEELDQTDDAGISLLRLGRTILRTETAAVAACATTIAFD